MLVSASSLSNLEAINHFFLDGIDPNEPSDITEKVAAMEISKN